MNDASWRTMDRAARSAAYNNSAAVADSAQQVARWARLSADLRANQPADLDLAYGPKPRNRVDIFAPDRVQSPLLIFIHGGYWQRNSKDGFSCIASGPLARGLSVALIGHTLTPEASLSEVADEIAAAIAFIRARDAERGAHRKVIVSGWSAGGHLAALARQDVDAVLPISGIFDLEPLRGTEIDDNVGLTLAEVEALSPIRHLNGPKAGPLVIAYGGKELPELRRQSRDYASACVAAGHDATLLPIANADHFSVIDALIEPSGDLTRAVVDLAARISS